MLTPSDEDLQKIGDMAVRMKVLSKPIVVHELIDREFVPSDIKPADIDVTKAGSNPQAR